MAYKGLCLFNKFGYCKYLDRCRKNHIKESCENQYCEVNKCEKRHPKTCRFYEKYERCKFGEDCYFSHKERGDKAKIVQLESRFADSETRIKHLENIIK